MANLFSFLEDDENEKLPEATQPQPEAPKAPLPFADQYKQAAANTTDIDMAKSDAARSKMWTGILQGLSTAFAGRDKTDSGFYNGLRQSADNKVKLAQDAHQQKLTDMLADRKVSSTMDPKSPYANSLRTILKAKGLPQIPETDRVQFGQYIDGASADELTEIAKQMGIGSAAKGDVKLVPGQQNGGKRGWFWADPNTRTMTPSGIDNPFAMGTVKDQLGDVYTFDKDGSTAPQKIFGTGQYQTAPEGTEFTETQLIDDLPPEKRKEVNRVKETFQKDPVVRKQREGFASASQIQHLLERAKKGEPVDRAQFGALMPRLAGEVGNLAEHDKAGWMKNPALINRAVGWFQQNANGSMTPEDINYVEGALNELRGGMEASLKAQEAYTAKQLQTVTGYRPEDAGRLVPRYSDYLPPAPSSGPVDESKSLASQVKTKVKTAGGAAKQKVDAFLTKNQDKFPDRATAIQFLKAKKLLPQDYTE